VPAGAGPLPVALARAEDSAIVPEAPAEPDGRSAVDARPAAPRVPVVVASVAVPVAPAVVATVAAPVAVPAVVRVVPAARVDVADPGWAVGAPTSVDPVGAVATSRSWNRPS
jgi:hypothetical protein